MAGAIVYWNWFAVPALLVLVLSWALAALVYRARPGSGANRRLAVLLVLEGASVGAGLGLIYVVEAPENAYAFQALREATLLALPGAYLLFLATVPARLVRPLGGRVGTTLLATLTLLPPLAFLAWPDGLIAGVAASPIARWDGLPGPHWPLVRRLEAGALLLGLLVAFAYVRDAPPRSLQRKQAVAYAVAFATRDLVAAASLVSLSAIPLVQDPLIPVVLQFFALGELVFVLLLSYAALKHQLFDIDLKIKWTLRRGSVVGAFVAVFVVVAQLGQPILTGALGWLAGGVAAALLLLALRPLERAAERLADRAMPRVQDTEEYRVVRKREVYRAAVESAAQDGVVTEKERDVLATLADKLGLSAGEARAIERDVAARAQEAI